MAGLTVSGIFRAIRAAITKKNIGARIAAASRAISLAKTIAHISSEGKIDPLTGEIVVCTSTKRLLREEWATRTKAKVRSRAAKARARVWRTAYRLCPVDTGLLRSTIIFRFSGREIGPRTHYMSFVERSPIRKPYVGPAVSIERRLLEKTFLAVVKQYWVEIIVCSDGSTNTNYYTKYVSRREKWSRFIKLRHVFRYAPPTNKAVFAVEFDDPNSRVRKINKTI